MKIVVLVGMALIAAPAWAQGGKIIKTRDEACQATVPADWTSGDLPGMADSPDKKLSAIVSSPKMMDSFAELKQTAPSAYPHSKVTKDTATEFEMEGQSITGKPDVYRAIPIAGNKFCVVEVTYERGTVDEPRSIARTLKSAK